MGAGRGPLPRQQRALVDALPPMLAADDGAVLAWRWVEERRLPVVLQPAGSLG